MFGNYQASVDALLLLIIISSTQSLSLGYSHTYSLCSREFIVLVSTIEYVLRPRATAVPCRTCEGRCIVLAVMREGGIHFHPLDLHTNSQPVVLVVVGAKHNTSLPLCPFHSVPLSFPHQSPVLLYLVLPLSYSSLSHFFRSYSLSLSLREW